MSKQDQKRADWISETQRFQRIARVPVETDEALDRAYTALQAQDASMRAARKTARIAKSLKINS